MSYRECGRTRRWSYPWWCQRDIFHEGPCALRRRWVYWFFDK